MHLPKPIKIENPLDWQKSKGNLKYLLDKNEVEIMKKNLPPEIQSVFQKKGIITSEAQLFLKTDMGREAFFCDAYTVATSEGIAALCHG